VTAPHAPTSAEREAFSARTVLALIVVSVVAFAGLGVLGAYAPELRGASDPGTHALSSSAVGYRGATVMLKASGVPVVVSRAEPHGEANDSFMVLTPDLAPGQGAGAFNLTPFARYSHLLIVLPKWATRPRPLHPGYVDKAGLVMPGPMATTLLVDFSQKTNIWVRRGVSRPSLYGTGLGVFATGTYLPLGQIDRLQTIVGDGWQPVLVDEQGRGVLVRSIKHPGVYLLSDPDLLNNQGLASLDNARAGMAILDALRGDGGVKFDVTMNGFARGRGLGRTLLEPPWLAFTLASAATAMLMGLHGLSRFGPVRRRARAIALGKRALVDNSAGLVRMAGREAELAPDYAALTKALIARRAHGATRAASEDAERWLVDLARLRGVAAPQALTEAAGQVRTRDDLLAVGRRLYSWRLEMTRERR
jgi:hypothetical protein